MRKGRLLVGAGATTVLAIAGYVAIRTGAGPLPGPEGCVATAGGHSVALSIDQAQNASTIAAVAERRGLPARAISIALAAAYQESDLANLTGGDRDSVGLFQQRPSQGWGTPEELLDPVYAANAFYDALIGIDGYQTMPITEAAQAVQRSAYPNAYADHEADARSLASALSGYSKAAFTCHLNAAGASDQQMQPNGLTPFAAAVRRDVIDRFGDLPMGGFAPGGVSRGRAGSAYDEGRAIDVFFRPINATSQRSGWALAQYLVANAERLHVDHVIFDRRIWSVSASSDGWRRFTPRDPTGNGTRATRRIDEHRDSVHVDVL